MSDLEPHLSALFQSLIDEMRVKYGEFGLARIYIDHPNLEKAIIVTPREIKELCKVIRIGKRVQPVTSKARQR